MKLVDYRKSLGLTQDELAEKLGVSRIVVARIELGTRRATVDFAQRLMRVFGLEVSDVWGMLYGEGMEK